ncbi:uncharacterized protein LOC142317781 [Lycorma delicatula]|uniref:uncharacterized protein LOC142317781 n=1 Tax=Lycorma delicatula TaxID=130591 RepID=UPI003F5117A2
MKLLKLLCLFLGVTAALMASPITEHQEQLPVLHRKKRNLVFPKGSSLQLVYCFLVAALGTENIFTIGITLGLAWEIPTDIRNVLKHKSPHAIRRHDARKLYPSIEGFLQRLGMDGRSCILRAICEATYKAKGNGSFIEEMMHAIFTSTELDLDCLHVKIDCPISVVDMTYYWFQSILDDIQRGTEASRK